MQRWASCTLWYRPSWQPGRRPFASTIPISSSPSPSVAATVFTAMAKHIDVKQAADLRSSLASQQPFVHLDVRNQSELEQDGFIPQTNHVPLGTLNSYHLPLDKEANILFSCKAGGRSAKAAQLAVDWGYKNVFTMDGGFEGWKLAGLPVQLGFQPQPFVKCLYDQPTGTCQFIVSDEETKHAVIIDPVLDYDSVACSITYKNADQILQWIFERGYQVTHILETHAHADHLTASQYLKEQLGGKPQVCIGEGITQVQQTFSKLFSIPSSEFQSNGSDFDFLFKNGDQFQLGRFQCKVLHVPGHTPDHLCYLIGDAVFAGDSIFMPDSGSARCDFPGGSAHQLYNSIQSVLFSLPPKTRLFVGHDYQPGGRPLLYETTVAEEMEKNKHVKKGVSEEEFTKMRLERDRTLGNPKLLFHSLQVNIRAGKFPSTKSELFPDRFLMTIPVTIAAKTPVESLKKASQ